MKAITKLAVIAGAVGLAVQANATLLVETVTSGQQGVSSLPPPSVGTVDLTGAQFNSSLGVLDSVTLSLTADLSDSSVGAVRIAPGTDPWNVNWAYNGSVSVLGLSSSWTGTGNTSVNPVSVYPVIQTIPINLTASSDSVVLTSGLTQFIGAGAFNLNASYNTTATWGSTPNNDTELANFTPFVGADLTVTYDYEPVPEASTMLAGALMLLPFGVSAIRIIRKKVIA